MKFLYYMPDEYNPRDQTKKLPVVAFNINFFINSIRYSIVGLSSQLINSGCLETTMIMTL